MKIQVTQTICVRGINVTSLLCSIWDNSSITDHTDATFRVQLMQYRVLQQENHLK